MILHINNSEYDYHTLVKVAEMAGLRALSAFTNPRTAILSAFRIQKTRRRLSRITKRVCVIWKTISGSTNCFSFSVRINSKSRLI